MSWEDARRPKEPAEDSRFGRDASSSFFTGRAFALVFGFAFIAPFFFIFSGVFFRKVIEISAPTVQILSAPQSLGDGPVVLEYEARDDGAGLGLVTVVVRQGPVSQQVFSKRVPDNQNVFRDTIEFKIGPSFKEGRLELSLVVTDESLWKRSATRTVPIFVDRTDPQVIVEWNAPPQKEGDTGFVLFTVVDANLSVVAVRAGERSFAAFPVGYFNEPNAVAGSRYLSVYPVPFGSMGGGSDGVTLRAEDFAGRTSEAELARGVKPAKSDIRGLKLSDPAVQRMIDAVFAANQPLLHSRAFEEVAKIQGGELSDEMQRELKLKLLTTVLRRVDDEQLSSVVFPPGGRPVTKQWKGPFTKPAGAFQSAFSTVMAFEREDGQTLGKLDYLGRILETPSGYEAVQAVAPGLVTFSGELGTFGQMVAVDHGLGVVSVYAGMTSVAIGVGAPVKRKTRVGTAGRTGLNLGQSGAIFALFVQGQPVDSDPWFKGDRNLDFLDQVLQVSGDS